MNRMAIGIAALAFMAVAVGVGADCWNKIDGPCGAGQVVSCTDFCGATLIACQSAGVQEVVSAREYEDCVEPGVSWVNCDDKETPKLVCTVSYSCTEKSDDECESQPGTYKCSTPGTSQTGHTVYWQTIETVYCGL